VLVKKFHPDAKPPVTPNPGDAGHDLFSLDWKNIPARESRTIRTGVGLEIPAGQVGLVWDRSGLAANKGITVLAGCIDSSYRGEIKVVLHNTSNSDVEIMQGDKIAQILFLDYHVHRFVEVQELSQTGRQEKGFGSSGA
jgi:dUTP pyrophosphatase